MTTLIVITLIVITLVAIPLSSSARYGLSKPSPDCRLFLRQQGKPIPFETRLLISRRQKEVPKCVFVDLRQLTI